MEIQGEKRDFYFDTLKGFLILCVIIGNSLELASPQNVDTHYFILFLYMFHMPMFTFVSGYFAKHSSRTTSEKVKETFKLYILAQLAYLFFQRFILWNTGTRFEFMYSQWTLWYLLSLTCWYVLSDYATNKNWIIGSILVSLIMGFDNSIGSLGSVSRTLFFFPFFVAGMYFDKKYIIKLKENKIKLFISSFIILLILFFLSHYTKIELLFEFSGYSTYCDNVFYALFIRVFHYIGAFIIGALILSLVPNIKTFLSSIGRKSLILYLLHGGISYILIGWGIARYNNLLLLILSEILIVLVTIFLANIYLKLKENYNKKKQH